MAANRFERRITIQASAKEIFDYVADLPRHAEWATNPLTVTVEGPGPIGVGTTFRSEAKLMGARSDTGRITHYEPPSRLEFDTEGPAGVVRNWFALRDGDNGCILIKGSENTRLSMFSRFMIPLLFVVVPRMYDRNLRAIKERVEGAAASRGTE